MMKELPPFLIHRQQKNVWNQTKDRLNDLYKLLKKRTGNQQTLNKLFKENKNHLRKQDN